jgi:hypothetical protein
MSADETAGATHHYLGVFQLHLKAPDAIRRRSNGLVSHSPRTAIRSWEQPR